MPIFNSNNGLPLENSEPLITDLSRNIPSGNFYQFVLQLEINFTQARTTLTQYKEDYAVTLRHILGDWENRPNATRDKLKAALVEAELGGLCYIVDKHFKQGALRRAEVNDAGDAARGPIQPPAELEATADIQRNEAVNAPQPPGQQQQQQPQHQPQQELREQQRQQQQLHQQEHQIQQQQGQPQQVQQQQQQEAARQAEPANQNEKHAFHYKREIKKKIGEDYERDVQEFNVRGSKWIIPLSVLAAAVAIAFFAYKSHTHKAPTP